MLAGHRVARRHSQLQEGPHQEHEEEEPALIGVRGHFAPKLRAAESRPEVPRTTRPLLAVLAEPGPGILDLQAVIASTRLSARVQRSRRVARWERNVRGKGFAIITVLCKRHEN